MHGNQNLLQKRNVFNENLVSEDFLESRTEFLIRMSENDSKALLCPVLSISSCHCRGCPHHGPVQGDKSRGSVSVQEARNQVCAHHPRSGGLQSRGSWNGSQAKATAPLQGRGAGRAAGGDGLSTPPCCVYIFLLPLE